MMMKCRPPTVSGALTGFCTSLFMLFYTLLVCPSFLTQQAKPYSRDRKS